MSEPVPFQETDDLSADLIALLQDQGLSKEQTKTILMRIIPYITRREHLIWNAAYERGWEHKVVSVTRLPVPTESQEGDMLVAYLRVRGIRFTHVPNETGQSLEARRRAVRMKRQGTSKGFPDYVVALPGVGVLYVELKRTKGSRTSPEQTEWLAVLNACPGSEAIVAHGAHMAIVRIEELYPASKDKRDILQTIF